MPKTLLGITASPRKNGNCELFIKAIYMQMGSDWDLRLMRLPELDIRPCKACYRCLFEQMQCPQEDDFLPALQELARADAFIVAAPAYLLAANGSLKKFLDRGLQFYAFVDQLWGKPSVAVAIAGIEGMEGSTKLDVERFAKLTMSDLRGAEVVYGALPGETLLSARNRETATRLAGILAEPGATRGEKNDRYAQEDETNPTVCPLCGGDTFRFMPGGRIRCMLCSSAGTYGWSENRLSVEVSAGDHPLFFGREDAVRHAEWLRGMKDKFFERRNELKEVARNYRTPVTWVGKREKADDSSH